MISAQTAFAAYAVLALLAGFTLDGDHRLIALGVLAIFAIRTYVEIMRRRIAAREAAERLAAATPVDNVRTGNGA
jgi:hypothetical protein